MKITINQLRQIIKEEISKSALMKEMNDFAEEDAAWKAFTTAVKNAKPHDNLLSDILHGSLEKLVYVMPYNPQLKSIQSDLLDQIKQDLSAEEQMEIIDGLEDRVREALGFEGEGYY
jgi:hypothetical protein